MFTNGVLNVTAGLGVALVAETCGPWDSSVLVAFLTVTIPLLVGQWFASRKTTTQGTAETNAVKEITLLREQLLRLGVKPDDSVGEDTSTSK